MGGKPWQSTGCLNCRTQKKKCDKKEPECERCLRRGFKCQGYEKLRFVFHENSPPKASEKKSKQLAGSHNVSVGQSQFTTFRVNLPVQQAKILNDGPSKREQLFSAYIGAYFPVDVTKNTYIDPWFDLMSGVSTLSSRPLMLEKAIAAKSCLFLSKINNDKKLFYHGVQLFNNAIQHMSHQLNQKHNAYSDELVFTVVIFSKLVSCYCPRGLDVWIGQMEVTNGILKQCARRGSNNPIIRNIYLAFHRMRLLQALSPLQSKSSIDITEDDFPIPPNPGEPVDRLLDLMTTISALLNANNTPNDCDRDVSYYQELLHDCILHKERLTAWYAREINSIGGRPSIYPPNESVHTSLPSAEHLFGASYRFPSLDNARITLLFWASLSILHGLIAQVRLRAYEGISNDAIADEDSVLTEFYADEISRSLPYCLQTSMKAWGVSVAIFGLSQICKVYMDFRRREKFTWSQHAFYIMGDLGFDFAFRLSEMLWHYWNLGEKTDSSVSPEASSASASTIVEEYESPTGFIEKQGPRQIRFTDD